MKKFALIVAGGNGNRMKSEVPKQFLNLLGKPILMHTIETFFHYDSEVTIILVLPKEWVQLWDKLCQKHQFNIKHQLIFGGAVRFQSVQNGLNAITEDGIVFIHDGVRPLVSNQTISNCYELAERKGNSLPVIPVSESVREVNEESSKAVDRSKYYLVQTPQTFWVSLIKAAYKKATSEAFTDDATVLENTGETIYTTIGNRENIKITHPEDLLFAEAILAHQ